MRRDPADSTWSFLSVALLQTDVNACYLRSARAGNLEKTLDYLKNGVDINICNQVTAHRPRGTSRDHCTSQDDSLPFPLRMV